MVILQQKFVSIHGLGCVTEPCKCLLQDQKIMYYECHIIRGPKNFQRYKATECPFLILPLVQILSYQPFTQFQGFEKDQMIITLNNCSLSTMHFRNIILIASLAFSGLSIAIEPSNTTCPVCPQPTPSSSPPPPGQSMMPIPN